MSIGNKIGVDRIRQPSGNPSVGKKWEEELFYDWELWLDEVWEDQV
ncbi:MAG: hypothetical protein HN704_17690 [Bacteroidetes bacterium]|jgi:hypothetical protein|nr:hypothetical protein [Bacteroidota bacterium]